MIQNLGIPEDQSLLEILNWDIMAGSSLARLDPSWIFHIKIEWFKGGMKALILKSDDSAEARNSEAHKKAVRNCEFDKSLEGICLRSISFILISTVSPLENTRYSFVGESDSVRWAIGTFRNYFWVTEFTVLSDCSGSKNDLNQRLMHPKWYTGGNPNCYITNY